MSLGGAFMEKIIFSLFLTFFSQQLMASEVNCFSHKDKQFHLAMGSEHISDFSFTSFTVAKKLDQFLGAGVLGGLARSGAIFIENDYCQETETEIKCQIVPNTIVNIYNIFGRVRVSKNGLIGFLTYVKSSSTLSFEFTNSHDQKMSESLVFDSSECQVGQ